MVQVLLPLYDNHGARVGEERFAGVRRELTTQYGGVTAYVRAPATGLWAREDGKVDHDEMVLLETMVEALAPEWWARYRRDLEVCFKQETIVARALPMQLL